MNTTVKTSKLVVCLDKSTAFACAINIHKLSTSLF